MPVKPQTPKTHGRSANTSPGSLCREKSMESLADLAQSTKQRFCDRPGSTPAFPERNNQSKSVADRRRTLEDRGVPSLTLSPRRRWPVISADNRRKSHRLPSRSQQMSKGIGAMQEFATAFSVMQSSLDRERLVRCAGMSCRGTTA